MGVYAAKHGETALDGEGADSPFAIAVASDVREPRREVRKLFDIVRDDVREATKPSGQPFSYGAPPGREDFYRDGDGAGFASNDRAIAESASEEEMTAAPSYLDGGPAPLR